MSYATRGGMELTEANKQTIDNKSYAQLLMGWRFNAAGDPWFQGTTGEYWAKRMAQLKEQDPMEAVRASKEIGW